MVVHTSRKLSDRTPTTAEWLGANLTISTTTSANQVQGKFAWSSFFAPFIVGASVLGHHYTGRFVAREHLNLLERYQVTTFCAPLDGLGGPVLEDISAYRFRHLREVMSAGEPLNPEVIMAWKRSTGLTIPRWLWSDREHPDGREPPRLRREARFHG